MTPGTDVPDDRPARFADVVADGRFRAVWTAQLLSVVGDQVARVALTVLVFVETASPALTALTYAMTFLPDIVAGTAVITTTYQVAQVLGFALGGPLVALVGVSPALVVNAATFVCSALVLLAGLEETPAAAPGTRTGAGLAAGWRVVRGDPRLGALVALACVSAFVVTIEGLAAPYAAQLGGGPAVVGLLLAAQPLGAALGIVALTRLVAPSRRERLLGPLAVLSCVPLIASALDPGAVVVVALWATSGLACAYQAPTNAAFVAAVPDAHRGQAFGLAVTALRVTQGVGVAAAGLVAEALAPSTTVALAGALGVLAASGAGWWWHRARRAPARADPGG